MKQITLTILTVLIIVSLLLIVIWGSKNKRTSDNRTLQTSAISTDIPVFFYGNTCPHCADVEVWLKENKIEEKISIVKKEVYDNQTNAAELDRATKTCGLNTNSIGVPFLYTEGKCLIGTPDIINYFTEKTK